MDEDPVPHKKLKLTVSEVHRPLQTELLDALNRDRASANNFCDIG